MVPSPLRELLATGISSGFLLVSGVIIIVLCAILSLSFLQIDQAAFATFPGENGKIAFASTRTLSTQIYTMDADGSNLTQLTNVQDTNYFPDWSPDGTKIAFTSIRDLRGNTDIYVMNADGSGQTRLTTNSDIDEYPTWSPDGTKIAFSIYTFSDNNYEIYVMNADGSNPTRLTNNPSWDHTPSWSPDGTKIAFSSHRDGNWEIYVMNADGSGQTRLTTNSDIDEFSPDWSPGGRKIAYTSVNHDDSNSEIYVMNADGSGQTNISNHPAAEQDPSWSPDGTKIAFASDRLGANEIYVMNADGSGQTNISNHPAGDFTPDWGSSGAASPPPPEEDAVPPLISVPEDIVVDATTANGGTVVMYSVAAEDEVDGTAILEEDGTTITQDDDGGDITISCEPSSGSEFPVGETIVECTATDAVGNLATASFTVTVNPPPPPPPDTTAPIITVPEDMTVEATSPDGAQVSFEVSAQDDEDGPVDVSCDHNSGETFPIGETVVTCSAEDLAGNRADEESFTITIQDTTAPDVEITQVVDRRNRVLEEGDTTPTPYIRVTFEATDAVGIDRTECSLDGQPFTSCTSPVVYDRLSRGTHLFTVRATDSAGNTGEDHFTWTINNPSAAAPGRQ